MAPSDYLPLPTSASPAPIYPPTALDLISDARHRLSPPYSLKSVIKHQTLTLRTFFKYTFGVVGVTVLLHYALLGAFPTSSYTAKYRQAFSGGQHIHALDDTAYAVAVSSDNSSRLPGTFFRDSFPIKTMLAFWELAEKEISERQLDTCKGQLGRELIDAYHRSQFAYCLPAGASTQVELAPIHNYSYGPPSKETNTAPPTRVWCMPVHHDKFSDWWPYTAAPCLSTNIRPVADDSSMFNAVGCDVTAAGNELFTEMGQEGFVGKILVHKESNDPEAQCKEKIDRTVIIIGRQDQWNPFHVTEDLITTLVTTFIMARAAPDLIDTRVQLVFAEGYGMDSNHFTPLWDRVGAWAPRRLSLDPWTENTCLTNVIHSVGAGASLVTAMNVARTYSCASTITWAASHYYRHLFGLLPSSLTKTSTHSKTLRRPINILWLSRAKFDSYTQKERPGDWSHWRSVRHIENEPALLKRLRSGLRGLCENGEHFSGSGCMFEDAQDVPETWALTSPEVIGDNDPVPLRFATIDPSVHALETQIHYVGHTSILVSSHGGAIGLSIFLPPGEATVIELQVAEVRGNYHFQHLASETGQNYEKLDTNRQVDVDQVWGSVQRWILQMGE